MKMIQAYVIQRREGDFPACAVVEMPVGSEPFMVIPQGDGLAVIALSNPKMPLISHPLIIMPAGVSFDVPIGERVGTFLGYLRIREDIAYVFKGDPWPTTMLEGMKPMGNS